MKLASFLLAGVALSQETDSRPDWLLPADWTFCQASSQIDLLRMGTGPGSDTNRIVGGGPAEVGTWPFIVRFQFGRNYLCGGSLIDGTTILTAAHCCYGYRHNDYQIFINDHYLFLNNDGNKKVKAKSVEYHKGFSWMTFKNDLCIFKLEEDVSEHVFPSTFPCLPPKNYRWEPGTRCYVAGWGLTSSKGKVSPELKSVNVDIIEDDYCMNLQDHSPKEMICAGAKGEGGRDACQGDSGGPLLCEIDGQVVLAGVTSWGIGCAQANHPGEWARVANYIDWIEPRMAGGKVQHQVAVQGDANSEIKSPNAKYSQADRLRIKRYCKGPVHGPLAEYKEINIELEGKQKFDLFLLRVTECYHDVKKKVLSRVNLVERETELLDHFGKRMVCLRARQRKHEDLLPCMPACHKLFADLKVRSPLTAITKNDRQKILYWSKLCRYRALKGDKNAKLLV